MTYPGPLSLYQNNDGRQSSQEASNCVSVTKTTFHDICNRNCPLNLHISVACFRNYCICNLSKHSKTRQSAIKENKNNMKLIGTEIVFTFITYPKLDYCCILPVDTCANILKQLSPYGKFSLQRIVNVTISQKHELIGSFMVIFGFSG